MLSYDDVRAAASRIAGRVRPVAVTPATPPSTAPGDEGERLWFALEFLQYTGSFKARGALNFTAAHLQAGDMPDAGVVIASGGNAGLACAWAAAQHQVPATVFVPETAPRVKVEALRAQGADVRLSGREYAEAAEAAHKFAEQSGALASHAYDNPLIAAGAGTLLDEIRAARPDVTTVVVATGGGGLFAGMATAAAAHGIRVVSVEPEGSRALHAGLAAGRPVDVPVDSVAADSLGARRASADAVRLAAAGHTRSVLVSDSAIRAARRQLWQAHRVVVEHAAATAYAALLSGAYVREPDEVTCVLLCGANTDPADLG
ncbi:serine/threonine dehydratase [Streptomyces sp. 7-21]|jgi:threonine dehydratase|uniref:serine/threonine dehydratase n=1 Tax=Streptomyces sp. 7-21 TaxID=2802283 RepID=UPI00191CB33C|nr:serine/threonine dehydratase [Streptomyces sp. 7-21]MBL1065384.1 serine/threonine dehydratase [Streptomyces sp. 7-21]